MSIELKTEIYPEPPMPNGKLYRIVISGEIDGMPVAHETTYLSGFTADEGLARMDARLYADGMQAAFLAGIEAAMHVIKSKAEKIAMDADNYSMCAPYVEINEKEDV